MKIPQGGGVAPVGLCVSGGGQVPLLGVEVQGEVLGAHARVVVRQRYLNREARPVEAIYTFPLPADATLAGFSMTADGRRVEGVVQEREKAFRTYDDALVAGHGAALVEQERSNVFTANVGNLLPGEETVLELEYLQRLAVDEGALRWMLPTLVAPRYIPGGPTTAPPTGHGTEQPTAAVPDADRITPPRQREVPYGLRFDLLFDLGRAVTVESPSHALRVQREEHHRVRVQLTQQEVAMDRDLVVVVAPEKAASAPGEFVTVAAHREGEEPGFFALGVVPDLLSFASASANNTVLFLIDTSGSMEGASLPQAQAALRLCLRHLREGDRFNVLSFNSSFACFSPQPVPFTQQTLAQADAWVARMTAGGGTELLAPLLEALRQAPDGVHVLLTDGEVGNEDQILTAVLAKRGAARFYSFGIGTNVSDALLKGLARESGGAVEFIYPGERIDEKVVAQFGRALAPRVTDLSVRFLGVDGGELAPSALPALVDGEPWVLYGRYEQPGVGKVELHGKLRGENFTLTAPVEFPSQASRPALGKLWASERIRDFEGQQLQGRRADAMKARIVELATRHGVASRYTSFVVVEKRFADRRNTEMPETRVVPVNLPAGWALFDTDEDVAQERTRGGSGGGAAKRKLVKHAAPPPPPVRAPMPARPAPMPAAPSAASASYTDGGDFLDDMESEAFAPPPPAAKAPPPMPARRPVPAPRAAPMAPPPAPRSAAPLGPSAGGSAALAEKKVASSSGGFLGRLRDAFAGAPAKDELAEASLADDAPAEAARAEAAPKQKVAAEDLAALFGRQLASGLWDERGRSGDDPLRAGRATAEALLRLAREGVTTSHALFGTQTRKAVEAVAGVLATVAGKDAALAEKLATLCWLVASGRRTRGALEAAMAQVPALAALRPRFDDEHALRQSALGA